MTRATILIAWLLTYSVIATAHLHHGRVLMAEGTILVPTRAHCEALTEALRSLPSVDRGAMQIGPCHQLGEVGVRGRQEPNRFDAR